MKVTLTGMEIWLAKQCATMRHSESIASGRKDAHGFDGSVKDGWLAHYNGAGGEIASARTMNRFWVPNVNRFKAPDLEPNIQVKTRSRDDYDLLIRPDDNPAHVFVLVTGSVPHFTVHGWIEGRDGMRDEWKKEHGGRPAAWFVPQRALWPISVLSEAA
jgi:hypothetical protein